MKTELPNHVRKLVAEIETEIGEGEQAVDEIEGDAARRAPATDRVSRIEGSRSLGDPSGRVEEAVREILLEMGEDPLGDLALTTDGYLEIGRRVGSLGRRLVVLQEGGYHLPTLGQNALAWLSGAVGSTPSRGTIAAP